MNTNTSNFNLQQSAVINNNNNCHANASKEKLNITLLYPLTSFEVPLSSPTLANVKRSLSNVYTPPHLERESRQPLMDTGSSLCYGTEIAVCHRGFLLYHLVQEWPFS